MMSMFKVVLLCQILFAILFAVTSVEAHYNVSVTVHSFHNPTSKCASCSTSTSSTSISSLGCCDNHDNLGTCSGEELCDPGFYFCLLPLNGTSFRDCVSGIGAIKTSPYYRRNATSVFPSSTTNQLLGLDDPFMLSGISNEWKGVQLHIWIWDADNIFPNGTNFIRDDDTIDDFYIPITNPVGVSTPRRSYTGIHGLATIELSFSVTCAPYYHGDKCEHLNECELNSVTCNGRGQCEDGVGSYTCTCEPRYTGTNCEDLNDCYLNSVTCNGNGQCVDGVGSYTCECDPGFTGMLCDQKQAPVAAIAGGVAGGVVALVVIIVLVVCCSVLLCKWWNKVPKTTTLTQQSAATTDQANTADTSGIVLTTLAPAQQPPVQQPPPAYPGDYPPQNYPAYNYYPPAQEQQGYPDYPPQMYPQYKPGQEMNKYPGVY